MTGLATFLWPARDVGTALEALAQRSGLASRSVQVPATPQGVAEDREQLANWIESTAAWLYFEAQPIVAAYQSTDALLHRVAPALLRVENGPAPNFAVVLKSSRRSVSLLTPDLHVLDVPTEQLRAELCAPLESPMIGGIEDFLTEMGIDDDRRASARRGLLRHRLRSRYLGGCWSLRSAPGASIWAQAREAGLPQRVLMLAGAHALEYTLWIVSWWLVGRAALTGTLDYGWMLGWALLLLTIVPFRLLGTWLEGAVAIGGGTLLKQRLLLGALRLEPEEVRHKGVGQFLSEVMESEAVESLALSGGFLSLLALIELIGALVVLGFAPGGVLLILLLLGWLVFTGALVGNYFRRRRRWTDARLRITQDLTEAMVGHRTRLAQEPREQWHASEDAALERYLSLSQSLDRASALLNALVPRGWLLVGVAGLAPSFASNAAPSASLAISLGGILLAYGALRKLLTGLISWSDAAISWKRVAPLFHAAARPEAVGMPAVSIGAVGKGATFEPRSIAEADDIVFRYPGRSEPVLSGCKLDIRFGDRLLLEGFSGGGKSTLASLLAGIRQPQSGLLLVGGMDLATLGADGWRRRVATAPQFHENHVLTETFAFNLLMGKRWPPAKEDLQEAETICGELGLGDLIERMPGGLLQMVGETGWRLSHGERSRLYIARTLLQGANLIILDESFAALDPENLCRCLNTVLLRASSLLIIAHP
jgi:ATP-binding cassette subfamily B protein